MERQQFGKYNILYTELNENYKLNINDDFGTIEINRMKINLNPLSTIFIIGNEEHLYIGRNSASQNGYIIMVDCYNTNTLEKVSFKMNQEALLTIYENINKTVETEVELVLKPKKQ